MIRLFTLFAALMLAQAASATQLYVATPHDGFLNLRTGPSTAHHVVHRMPHGSVVDVLAMPGKWYRVQHESGHVGWTAARFLSDDPQTRRPADTTARLDRYWVDAPGFSGLNLRAGPGTRHAVLITMAQGSPVEELGRKGKWRLLRHTSGRVGWAHGGYLTDTKPFVGKPRKARPNTVWAPRAQRRSDTGWRANPNRNRQHDRPHDADHRADPRWQDEATRDIRHRDNQQDRGLTRRHADDAWKDDAERALNRLNRQDRQQPRPGDRNKADTRDRADARDKDLDRNQTRPRNGHGQADRMRNDKPKLSRKSPGKAQKSKKKIDVDAIAKACSKKDPHNIATCISHTVMGLPYEG